MSTRYNTGNPIESTDVRDMSDNAKNFDLFSGSELDTFVDRLGETRLTIEGAIEKSGFKPGSGDFVTGFTVMPGMRNISWKNPSPPGDNNFYSWDGPIPPTGKFVPAGSTPETTGGVIAGAWRPRTDVILRDELAHIGGVGLVGGTPVTVTNSIYAGGAVPDGTTLNDAAFLAAEETADDIYVPDGVYRLSTPMVLGYTKNYYGTGVLKFDNAEHWRRGGSAGGSLPENYTLFYEYANQSDVTVTFDDVVQPITWIDAYTVQAPTSTTSVNVRINITNGTLKLGDTPEAVRSYNVFANGGGNVAPSLPNPVTSPVGMNNYAAGARALPNLTTGANNTAIGSKALLSLTEAINNTAVGFQSLYRASGHGNTAVGSIAGEWVTTGEYNTLTGAAAGAKITTGGYNTAMGYQALGEAKAASYTVSIGHRAHGNAARGAPEAGESVAIGAFAGDGAFGGKNVHIGYRAGATTYASDGAENVFIGFFAGRNHNGADFNVGVGVSALSGLTSGQGNVALGHSAGGSITKVEGLTAVGFDALKLSTEVGTAVGYRALSNNTTGIDNVAVGTDALFSNSTGTGNTAVGAAALFSNTGSSNTGVGVRAANSVTSGIGVTAVGFESGRFMTDGGAATFVGSRAGRASTGGENTAIGSDALQLNTTGVQNTAIGRVALRFDQTGANQTAFNNTTGVGFGASVSGSNQVQLGNSLTTTYVYGTVQNRSDERDKADIQDTELGIEFIMGLRPVDGRWDMRDDYFEEYQVQVGIDPETAEPLFETRLRKLPKDGSKARARKHHWFIAQEVKELCDNLGVDFGGYQDHTVNGGCDALSLGYDEFIPPTVKAVQQCWTRLDELEKRIAALE